MWLRSRTSQQGRSARRERIVERPPDLITGWPARLFIGSAVVLTAVALIGGILTSITPTLGVILVIAAALLLIILCVIIELVWRLRWRANQAQRQKSAPVHRSRSTFDD
jgi:hypothetical protein